MWRTLIGAAAAVVAASAVPTLATAATGSFNRDCFHSTRWESWEAAAGGDALYLRVGPRDVYRVDLTPGSHVRKSGGEFLVNRPRGGSNLVCSTLDLDLSIADGHGFHQALFPTSLRKLTPDEVAAIPPKYRP